MSERLDFKGDYMGFTYNDHHSSSLGIVRVSNGSRFEENLLPIMQDKTVQIPGGDGSYYFGSQYKQREFTVNFAFDSLTEAQIAEMRRIFGDKGVHDLIFDETPYKVWSAKVTGTSSIKYLAFNEGTGKERVYKGEGSIQFTCFYPFARCWSNDWEEYYKHPAYRILNPDGGYFEMDEMPVEDYRRISARINEWWDASRIGEGGNFGDIPIPFSVEIRGTGSLTIDEHSISWSNIPSNVEVILNTKIGLATGSDEKIYNQYLTGNTLMKIPAGETQNLDNLRFTCEYF